MGLAVLTHDARPQVLAVEARPHRARLTGYGWRFLRSANLLSHSALQASHEIAHRWVVQRPGAGFPHKATAFAWRLAHTTFLGLLQ